MNFSLADKMKIVKVEAENEHSISVMKKSTFVYEMQGAEICIKENGAVILKGNGQKLSFVKITFRRMFGDVLVLGDAWERAYGELEWRTPQENEKMPWYFLAYKEGKTFGFGVKTNVR